RAPPAPCTPSACPARTRSAAWAGGRSSRAAGGELVLVLVEATAALHGRAAAALRLVLVAGVDGAAPRLTGALRRFLGTRRLTALLSWCVGHGTAPSGMTRTTDATVAIPVPYTSV